MTDVVTIGIITNVSLVIMAIIGKWDRKKISDKMDVVRSEVNGMKSELVEKTHQLGEAIGMAKGREAQKMESERPDPFVIILDDDTQDLEFMQEDLTKLNIRNVILFSDEDEFLEQLTDRVNVYIIDHKLPKRNGLNIVHSAMKKNENSFFIICTGSSPRDVEDIYHNTGVDYVLHKNEPNYKVNFEKYVTEGLRKVSLRK